VHWQRRQDHTSNPIHLEETRLNIAPTDCRLLNGKNSIGESTDKAEKNGNDQYWDRELFESTTPVGINELGSASRPGRATAKYLKPVFHFSTTNKYNEEMHLFPYTCGEKTHLRVL
jgi:hypothetical protein